MGWKSWYRTQHIIKIEYYLELTDFQAGSHQLLVLPCWSVFLHREQRCPSVLQWESVQGHVWGLGCTDTTDWVGLWLCPHGTVGFNHTNAHVGLKERPF